MYEEKEIKYKKRKRIKRINKRKPIIRSNSFLNKINFKMLLLKLVILIIVMVLIIFTISRINKYNKDKTTAFNNNINEITTAALTLFDNEIQLKNVGDSTSILLDEMKNNNILNELKDKDGASCDYKNSYIIITKTKQNEYSLKIYLKCNKEDKTTELTIACNEKCQIK